MIQQLPLPQDLLQLLQQLQQLIQQQQAIQLQINQLPEIMGPQAIAELPQPPEYINQQRQSRQQLIQQLGNLAGVLGNQQQQLLPLNLDIVGDELGAQRHQQIQQIEEQQRIVKEGLYQQIRELDQSLIVLQIYEEMYQLTPEHQQNIVQGFKYLFENDARPKSPPGSNGGV